jgi:hypothetical protein
MKTYLIIWINSEGSKPSDISDRLLSMGFQPVEGEYDYLYKWDSRADINDIIKFGDQVQNTLKGSGVLFKLETIS